MYKIQSLMFWNFNNNYLLNILGNNFRNDFSNSHNAYIGETFTYISIMRIREVISEITVKVPKEVPVCKF